MAGEHRTAWIGVFGVIAAAVIAGVFAMWTPRADTPRADTPPPSEPKGVDGPAVMGQLEMGINRQGMDLSAREMAAPNAAICAELCRTNNDCKSMTYVVSLQTCWLKRGVPPPFPPGGSDYISAVKQ